MDLSTYLRDYVARADRLAFADRCDTTWGHLKNVANGSRPCNAILAINIDRESRGMVPVEENCPEADWAYIRKSRRRAA